MKFDLKNQSWEYYQSHCRAIIRRAPITLSITFGQILGLGGKLFSLEMRMHFCKLLVITHCDITQDCCRQLLGPSSNWRTCLQMRFTELRVATSSKVLSWPRALYNLSTSLGDMELSLPASCHQMAGTFDGNLTKVAWSVCLKQSLREFGHSEDKRSYYWVVSRQLILNNFVNSSVDIVDVASNSLWSFFVFLYFGHVLSHTEKGFQLMEKPFFVVANIANCSRIAQAMNQPHVDARMSRQGLIFIKPKTEIQIFYL